MIGRKISAAILTVAITTFLMFLLDGTGASLFIGVYSLPIVLLYGIPTSIISDGLTKRFSGITQKIVSLFLHTSSSVLFIILALVILGFPKDFSIYYLISNFFFLLAVVSSILVWLMDEGIKSTLCLKSKGKVLFYLNKLGNMRL
ncbi:hypothetical protein [Mangrovibacillus cuniculi]|uniref:Uncharacterized protein n=1 Tax=Mangrovibacillus cuniculi TaxID=2593652 RepID=A0A7S8HFJ2_9BACI|nr:hypothetical protein [Mangrovibacillus cuniculi]QPC46969.1 hypothetical protein G8O30_08340 [Mangrovibacillus cuniculi]